MQNPLSKPQDIELVLEDRLNVAAEKAAHDPAQAAAIAAAAKAAESERGVQDEETRDALVAPDPPRQSPPPAHDENDTVAGAALADPPPALADTDSYGRKYSARSGPSAVAVAAGAAQLVTHEEAVQQIEADLRQPVLRARLKLVQQAFTRTGGRDEARNLDLAAVRRSGFDNYLTDTVSRRFRVGEAVLVSFDGKKAAALGKPTLHAPPCRACLSSLSHSLTHLPPPPTTRASSAPSPRTMPAAAGSSTPSRPSATAASARLS